MASANGIELETLTNTSQLPNSSDSYDNFGYSSTISSSLVEEHVVNFKKEKLNCKKHTNYEVMFYCQDCFSPVCTQCIINHTDHHMSSFTAATTTVFGNLMDHVDKLNNLKKLLKETQQSTLERIKIMEKSKTEAKKVVDHQFALMHAKLDAAYSKMTETLEIESTTYLHKCDKLIESITIINQTLDPYDSLLHNSREDMKSEVDIFSMENSARKELEFVKSRMPEFSAPDLEILTLKWNPSIANMFAEDSEIGKVDVQTNLLECHQLAEFSVKHVNDKNIPHIESIAALENGNIVVVDSNNAKLKVFSNMGRLLFCFVGAGKFNVPTPKRVIALPDGKLIVSDYTSKIVLFNSNGTGSAIFSTDSVSNGICFLGSKICSDEFILDDVETQTNEKLHDGRNSESDVLVTKDFSQHTNVFIRNKRSPISYKSLVHRSHSQSTLRSLDGESDEVMTQYDIMMGNSALKSMEILQICGRHLRKAHEDIKITFDSHLSIRALNIAVSPLNNNIYFVDETSKSLLVFDEHGDYLYSYNRCAMPVSVLCDKQGNVLVLDSFNSLIHLLDTECNFLQYLKIHSKKSKSSSELLLVELQSPTAFTVNESTNSLIIGHRNGFVKVCTYGKR